MSCAIKSITYLYVKSLITSVIHLYAGEVQKNTGQHINNFSFFFHYVNPIHPSSGGKLCMWTGFVLMIE